MAIGHRQRRCHQILSVEASDGNEVYKGASAWSGGRQHRANVKILRNLAGVPGRVFDEHGGAWLPQAPPVAMPLAIADLTE